MSNVLFDVFVMHVWPSGTGWHVKEYPYSNSAAGEVVEFSWPAINATSLVIKWDTEKANTHWSIKEIQPVVSAGRAGCGWVR